MNICDIYRQTEIGKLGIKYHGQSMVIRAFTGAGKTLFVLCEVMKWALEHGYGVVYTTGLRSAVQEFVNKVRQLYGESRVGYLMGMTLEGDRMTAREKEREWQKPIVIATYEQAVMRLMRGESKDVLVIDEFHNVLTEFRKYKLLFLLATARKLGTPVVLLSATMPDKDRLVKYLNAEYYDIGSNWRGKDVKTIRIPAYKLKVIEKYVSGIISSRQSLNERGIVFVNSRRFCDELGKSLGVPCVTSETPLPRREEILSKFRRGTYRWLVATSVLSESINEPFDDAIIIVNKLSTPFQITQMAGRVGRFGGVAVIYILYPVSFELCVKNALEENYGKITIGTSEYTDLLAAYAELVPNVEKLKEIIANTIGVEDPPEKVLEIARYNNVVEVRGNAVYLTNVGKWMNTFLARYDEYRIARECMTMNRNPYAAWFCFTVTTSARGFRELRGETRDKYRDWLTGLLGYDPYKIQFAVPPHKVYTGHCGAMDVDIIDIITTYGISLNVGDWLTYILTGAVPASMRIELDYARKKLEALGLEIELPDSSRAKIDKITNYFDSDDEE